MMWMHPFSLSRLKQKVPSSWATIPPVIPVTVAPLADFKSWKHSLCGDRVTECKVGGSENNKKVKKQFGSLAIARSHARLQGHSSWIDESAKWTRRDLERSGVLL